MIVKRNFNGHFVGPKALFDPRYIPPEILHRKKDEKNLFSLLKDSLADDFCLNILYQGIQGIGKKVIVNKVLNDLSGENNIAQQIQKVSIDCNEKTIEELMGSLLVETSKLSQVQLDPNSILNSTNSQLWSVFKLLSRKLNNKFVLILNNTENLKPDVFKKFLHFGKESKISMISTINKILKPSSFELLSEFDMKKRLNYFTYKELLNIFKQRVTLTFPHEIDSEMLEFITDLIFEHFVPVPGKGIDILREVYPVLKDQYQLEHHELLDVCQNQFDTFQVTDEFNMLSYISEKDILIILFLDNLSNHFIKSSKFYITSNELKELYDISCESLEYVKTQASFKKTIDMLLRIGILSESKKNNQKKETNLSHRNIDFASYFLVINPNQLKAMVDAIFTKF